MVNQSQKSKVEREELKRVENKTQNMLIPLSKSIRDARLLLEGGKHSTVEREMLSSLGPVMAVALQSMHVTLFSSRVATNSHWMRSQDRGKG